MDFYQTNFNYADVSIENMTIFIIKYRIHTWQRKKTTYKIFLKYKFTQYGNKSNCDHKMNTYRKKSKGHFLSDGL